MQAGTSEIGNLPRGRTIASADGPLRSVPSVSAAMPFRTMEGRNTRLKLTPPTWYVLNFYGKGRGRPPVL